MGDSRLFSRDLFVEGHVSDFPDSGNFGAG